MSREVNEVYANYCEVSENENEVIINFHFRTGEVGRHSRKASVILSPDVAVRLGFALAGDVLKEQKEGPGVDG